MSTAKVARVLQVEIENFRGFKTFGKGQKPHAIDTDADLVLLSGPNGSGKTSLLEALLLLLTGWYDADAKPLTYPERALVSRLRAEAGEEAEPAENFRVRAEVEDDAKKTLALETAWKRTEEANILALPEGLPFSPLRGEDEQSLDARELDARLTGFFQGRIDRLFDQAAKGHTFRDIFDPLPPPVRATSEQFEDLKKRASDAKQETIFKDVLEPSAEVRRERLGKAWRDFNSPWRKLVALLGLKVPQRDAVDGEDALDALARELTRETLGGKALREGFRETIDTGLKRAIRQAETEARESSEELERLEKELEKVELEIEDLEREYPDLDRELALFAMDGDPRGAWKIFHRLEHHAQRWAAAEVPAEELMRVREEFAKVSPTDAGKCAEILDNYLVPRETARKRLDGLTAEKIRLKKEIARARTSEKLRDLLKLQKEIQKPMTELLEAWEACHEARDHEGRKEARRRARARLDELEAALDRCQREVKKRTGPSEEIMNYLRDRAGAVMDRYSMVEGCLPLRLELPKENDDRGYHVALADGRSLEHLSSGQKAQVALALLVGQNQGAAHLMAHRVILLDDITTDYDLSNLSRQAILLRKLAYGATEPEDRRQVFLSSHHEDMTNQVLDLLAPPEGASMRLIRFVDWSNVTGPRYDVLEVEPSAPIDQKKLANDLGGF